MMRIITTFFLVACSLAFMDAGCRRSVAGTGSDPTDLLPLDNDISGFTRKGSAAIMTDEQSIFAAIDGAAEKYIDYGFQEGVQQMFGNGAVDVGVEIFKHSSEENAQGIYLEFYPSSPEVISSSSPQVVVDYALQTIYTLQYQYQGIFMRINTSEKTDFALNMAKQFYLNIHTKILAEGGE